LIPRAISRGIEASANAQRDVRLAEVKVLDKVVALLSVKDPLSFQQIQAMGLSQQYDADYDPSDEGEIRRIHERLGERDDTEEQMTDAERAFLDDFFPGSGFRGTSVE
jgi:hypothetical protein